MTCPECKVEGGQGAIYKGYVVDLNTELYICDECEACWTSKQEIANKNFKLLTLLLESNGITYDNAMIKDLGYVDV